MVSDIQMAHHGVKVCFVSQQMDSSEENFAVLLNTFSMIDQMYTRRSGAKVVSGTK
ncbi:MAG: hypothetical protein HIU93_10350 [Acidobacteria bacterium]|nr:hypothetical protein [Acidobacteriota bacterium]MBW4046252.1 hypothetical protein [Acidobacteriota bacterium]